MTHFDYVDTDAALTKLLDALEQSTHVALDTEFMREKTYYAKLCLLQISVDGRIFCVDPLADLDLAPLWPPLLCKTLVVHAGRQDFEVLFQAAGKLPTTIVDTQIAAALLGHPPQIGYANLVNGLLDIELDKSHTRADWTRRPLADSVLHYAAEDVLYLMPAHAALSAELQSLERLHWLEEDSAALLQPELYESMGKPPIERVKGAGSLQGRARLLAELIADWREQQAERSNRPRQWILRDNILLGLAVEQPTTIDALAEIRDLPPSTARRYGETLLDLVNRSAGKTSAYVRPEKPSDAQRALQKRLASVVAQQAEQLGIAAELLATKKELNAAVSGNLDSRVFGGWRGELIGGQLRAELDS